MALAIDLSPRMRRILRYVAIALVGPITFVFALQMTLPVERAKDKLIEALSPSYDVSIGSVERGFMPGRIYLHSVSLRTRPSKPDEQPTTLFIDRLEVDLGLFAVLRGNLSIDFDARLEPNNRDARLSGNVTLAGFGRKGIVVHAGGKDVPGADLPLRGLIGLPMTGKLDLDVALDLPFEPRAGKNAPNWQKVEGSVDFGCPSGCTFGDGKTKLKPILKNKTQQVMVADGIDFGKVDMDSLDAHAEFKNGNLEVTKFESSSKDGEVHVDYAMKLEPDIMDSMVTGCLRFTASEALLKRDRKTYDAINLSGAERRSDGFFHILLTDRLREMKRLNQECGPNVHHTAPESPHVTVRPTMPPPPPPNGSGEETKPGGPPTSPPSPGLVAPRLGPERPIEPGNATTVKPAPAAGPAAGGGSEGSATGATGGPEGQAPEGSAAGSGEPNPPLQ